MSISLILIGVISLAVVAGTAYLFTTKNEELTQDKKNKILLIVGTVIFISFLVTTFKHRKIGLNNKDLEDGTINIKKVFFGNGCNFDYQKTNNHGFEISEEILSEVYAKNYLSLYDKPAKTEDLKELTKDYQEIIVYLSGKDEGASYFLNSLASKKCRDMRMPVVYLNLDKQYRRQNEFLQAIGVNSFQQLEKYMCHFSGVQKKQTKFGTEFVRNNRAENSGPYLIIDNFQKLLNTLSSADNAQNFDEDLVDQIGESTASKTKGNSKLRLFERILDQLVGRCRINIILNTEKHWALQELHEIWEQIQETHNNRNKNRFQFHRWQALNQYSLYKILNKQHPNHDAIVTKLIESHSHNTYTFKQLFSIADDLKSMTSTKQHEITSKTARDELHLKEWNIKYNVAKYFGLEQTYCLLKTLPDKKVSILKNKMRFSDIQQLQQIGLLQIADGIVILK